jgi:hypothetical protein
MTQAATPTSTDAYIPGVCNINRKEIANRRMIGFISLAVLIVLLAILVFSGVTRWLRLIIALPAIIMISGFLQARNHFCVGYAGAGQQNATEGSDKAVEVIEDAARKADKKRASTMNRQSFVGGIVIALLTLLIPVIN